MDLEKIVVTFVGNASQYNRVVDGVEARMLGLARTAGLASAAINVPFIAAAGALGALAVATSHTTIETLKLANSYQQASIAFEVMTGSAASGKKLLDDITQLAIETPFKTPELLAGAQTLKAFGTETEQVIPILRTLGDVASGVGPEKLDRIVLAFGQVRVAGRLMGQELRQFINAGVPLIEALAKTMGKPVQAITGLVEQGRIGYPEVVKAFRFMTDEGGLFFNMMERQSQTVGGRWSAFTETIQVTMRKVGVAFFEEFGIASFLDGLTKSLTSGGVDFNGFFKDLKETLQLSWGFAKLTWFWIDKVWQTTKSWVEENEQVLLVVGKYALIFGVVFVLVKGILVTVAGISALVSGISIIGFLTNPLVLALAATAGIVLALQQIGAFEGFGDSFFKGLESLEKNFKGFFGGLKDSIIAQDWELAGKLVAKGFEIGFMTIFNMLSAEIAGVLATVITVVGRELTYRLFQIENFVESGVDVLDPALNEGQRAQRKGEREKALEDWMAKEKKIDEKAIKGMKRRFMEEMDVYNGQVQALVDEAKVKREASDFKNKYETNPGFRMFVDYNRDFVRHKEALDAAIGVMQPGNPDANLIQEYLNQDTMWKNRRLAGASSAIMLAAAATGGWTGATKENSVGGILNERPSIPMALDPRIIQMANRIDKEMTEGKWGGQQANQFSRFMENMNLLEQGRYGIAGRTGLMGALFGKPGGVGSVLNKDQYEFGMFEEYQNLRKIVGSREVNYPRAMFRGSQEAQDAINKAQYETKTVQEEVRDLMRQALIVQQEQRDYQKQVVEELQKIRGVDEPGNFGGGGDF